MKQVVFHAEAEKELIASAEYYENRQNLCDCAFKAKARLLEEAIKKSRIAGQFIKKENHTP